MSTRPQPLPGWLAWPIRIVAVVVVVPFRLAWDLLVLVGGFLWRYLGIHVARFVYAYLLRPLGYACYYVLWLPLRFLAAKVLWPALVWLATYVLVPCFEALWRAVLFLKPALRVAGHAVAVVMRLLYRFLLRPLGLAIGWLWRWIVVPVAQAVGWAWNHSVVLLWRYLVVIPVRWAWQTVATPTGRWIADATRRILATVGLR